MNQKYQVEDDLLGQGYFGSVKQAKSKINKSLRVCVKIMNKKQHFGENVLQTIQEPEFNICKKMINKKYDNLVQIYDVYDSDVNDEHAYIFMERCDMSLKQFINQKKSEEKQFSKEELINIIKQIANGYNQMISEQIIHRDLKPENILCNIINNQLTIKIADFGLSKIQDPSLNKMMTKKVGTSYYCAPEILVDENFYYDNQCDIFSLGVIIFELALLQKQFLNKQVEKLKVTTFSKLHENVLNDFQIDKDILDLLNKMIVYDPKCRLTWQQLLNYFDRKPRQLGFEDKKQQLIRENSCKDISSTTAQKYIHQYGFQQPNLQQPQFQQPKMQLLNFQQQTFQLAQVQLTKFQYPETQQLAVQQPGFQQQAFQQFGFQQQAFQQPGVQQQTFQQPGVQQKAFQQPGVQQQTFQQPGVQQQTFQQPGVQQQTFQQPGVQQQTFQQPGVQQQTFQQQQFIRFYTPFNKQQMIQTPQQNIQFKK